MYLIEEEEIQAGDRIEEIRGRYYPAAYGSGCELSRGIVILAVVPQREDD